MTTTQEQIERIAVAFVVALEQELTAEEWREMCDRNRSKADPYVCHSHDFCDANVVMDAAFTSVVGRECDLHSDTDGSLWDAAWNFAGPALCGDVPGWLTRSEPDAAMPLRGRKMWS